VTVEAALLDVAGTVIDSDYQHALAWYRAFRRHGIVLPVWRVHRAVGMGGDQLVPALVGPEVDRDVGDAVRDSRTELYHELNDEVAPLDGAHELIVDLKERGLRVVLASSSPGTSVITGGWSVQVLRDAGAVAVFESVQELRKRLDETRLAAAQAVAQHGYP
jgi:beta-phosphoglucomutase-like phosphatase (HAD superfamily)